MLKHSTFFNNENRADWLKVFNDLTERGVKRIMIIVSDDSPSIANAIEKIFPDTDHQLCFIHLQRNLTAQMSKQDAKFFKKELNNIKNNSLDFE